MPHPRPTNELPEYPVRPRPRSGGAPVVSVWVRWPLGSRLVAAGLVALVLATLVGVARGSSRQGDGGDASALVVDESAQSTDGGLAPDDGAVTVEGGAVEGTLPPTVPEPASVAAPAAAAPATARATAAPATAARTTPATRAAATATTAAAKKAATTTATTAAAKKAATTATTAKKAAATTTAPKKTTTSAAKAAVKQPSTTARKATTTATTVAPKRTWTTDEVQALIRQMWPADSVDRALEIAYNESRYRSDAYNGWCCYGVFQINASAQGWRVRARGLSTADLYDAVVNIEIARDIFQDSGWGPWGG